MKATPSPLTTRKRRIRAIPSADADLLTLAKAVLTRWTASELQLRWTDVTAFAASVATLQTSYAEMERQSANRYLITRQLATINADIDRDIEPLKGYLAELYGRTRAVEHYKRYGIVRQSRMHKLPRDNDKRQQALAQLVAALEESPFADNKYGLAHWTALQERFEATKAAAQQNDSAQTASAIARGNSRRAVRKALSALRFRIQSDYPDSYREQFRIWGFQKEKY